MPSTILSDNGVTSGTSGLKTSGGNDGTLILQTTTAGGTATTALTIDTSQNVGIGVTPAAWASDDRAIQLGGNGALYAKSAAGATKSFNMMQNAYDAAGGFTYISTDLASKYSQVSGTHQWSYAASGTAGNAITFTEAMRIDSSGNVGIGTSSPTDDAGYGRVLDIRSATGAAIYLRDSDDTTNDTLIIGRDSANSYIDSKSGALIIYNAGSERARITSGGDLLVGKTATGTGSVGTEMAANGYVRSVQSASANTSTSYDLYSTGASAYRFYVGLGGTIYATSTTISAISDQRLKENIQDIDVGLDAVLALKPRKFDWKEGKGKDKKGDRGWIAQEFEQVFPEMIDVWKDEPPEGEEPYKSVNADLIPVLTKAIQELKAINDTQATRIETLEAQNSAFEARLAALESK